MVENEMTYASDRFPQDVVDRVLAEGRISAQALWLLFSLDQYGWRVEQDAIRLLLEGDPRDDVEHFRQHAPLLAFGHLFALADKLWRLVLGMRAHRAGREFLNVENGYLKPGYKFHARLAELLEVTEDEWRALLSPPTDDEIRAFLGREGASPDEIVARIAYRDGLPSVMVENVHQLHCYVEEAPAIAGPRDTTYSLRGTDGQHRHGAPLVYHDCSPTETGWRAVDHGTASETRADTIGIIMSPPDETGAAHINLFKYDREMVDGINDAASILAARIRLLVKAHLRYVDVRLVDPLATATQYD